jgi:hypothetical protein
VSDEQRTKGEERLPQSTHLVFREDVANDDVVQLQPQIQAQQTPQRVAHFIASSAFFSAFPLAKSKRIAQTN